ncbi:MAG: DUF5312 family protein [Brevinematales bacterium]|nr:DUF5312 family protein [Brevinematales bacterium]
MTKSKRLEEEIVSMTSKEREELRKKMQTSIKNLKTSNEDSSSTREHTTKQDVYLSAWDKIIMFLLSLFGIMSYEGYIRRKRINTIKDSLSRTSYDIINVRTNELLPQFGKYIYEIYSTLNAIGEILNMTVFNPNVWDNTSNPEFKTCSEFLFEFITNTRSLFGISDVKELISEYRSLKKIFDRIEVEVENNLSSIDLSHINRANRIYSRLFVFREIIKEVDFRRIIKYFIEGRGKISKKVLPDKWLAEEIEKLCNILSETDITPMIIDIIMALKKYIENIIDKSSEDYKKYTQLSSILTPENLNNTYSIIEKLNLPNIICVIKDDPDYIPLYLIPEYSLVNVYKDVTISKSKNLASKIIRDIINDKTLLFYTSIGKERSVIKQNLTTIYTEENNDILVQHNLNYFSYATAFEIIYAFHYYHWRISFKEGINDIIVNGIFKEKYFKTTLSMIFQSIEESEKDISNFIKQTSYGGEHYNAIINYLEKPSSLKSEQSKKLLQQRISAINNLAGSIVIKYNDNLSQLVKFLKLVLNDHSSLKPEYILNIKTIKGIYNKSLIELIKKSVEILDSMIDIISYYSN